MRLRVCLSFAIMLCSATMARSSNPAISPGGMVNAASYGNAVAPGSIAAVFGSFPVSTPAFASGLPLPSALSQISIFVGGEAAPLFFISSTQANVQIPWDASVGMVGAAWNGSDSSVEPFTLVPYAPGIFSMNGLGTGQGAITDSAGRLVDDSNPGMTGVTTVAIYCTGLGAVANGPATGAAAPLSPLIPTVATPAVTIGGAPATVLFSGLAPGTVGVYQVNVLVPASAQSGASVPVTLAIGAAFSNTVTMAIAAASPAQRASQLLPLMTQAEKLQLVHGAAPANASQSRGAAGWVPGIPRLGIPALYFADGSVGVGEVGPATALPSSLASAASWDLAEAYRYGAVIGSELRAYGVNVNLGGNVNLTGREPRDGRTFETKGEDPILAGRIGAAHVRAIQDLHVLGCFKHFALNDQETGRATANAVIGERAARESDLLAFEIGVKDSNVQSVMCAYNLVNGIYSCENPFLLSQALKSDWGFAGFVMSDWGATHSTAAAANAGLDQEQPDGGYFSVLGSSVESGAVAQSRLDDMVTRILRAMFTVGLFDYPAAIGTIDSVADQAIAQEEEEQGAVLLKNAAGELPLSAGAVQTIAVIGSQADLGVLSGGGSAQVFPTGGPALQLPSPCPPCFGSVIWDPSSPLQSIRAIAPNSAVTFDDGTNAAAAAALAASSDRAIVFVSQWASEALDLPSLNLTDLIDSTPVDQDALVAAVAAANTHTTVIVESGGPIIMPWLDDVNAVLEAWYPGQRGGEAIANLLFGAVNPSGKLPITFPASVADLPRPAIPQPPDNTTPFAVDYLEGMNVGYKWYDTKGITPLFPFGFGLSYTAFSISGGTLVNNLNAPAPNIQVAFDIANTGTVAGAEIAQVYLGLPAALGEAPRRLVGWQKVPLAPGQRMPVTIEVDRDDSSHPLSYWDTNSEGWVVAPGDYTVYLGNSSSAANLTVVGTFHVGP